MVIRCRHCNKVFNDRKEDGYLCEGTCKRCAANGREDKGTVALLTLKQMLDEDPAFAKAWEENGCARFFA